MFCPPGFRRFDELFPLCLEVAHKEVEAGRFLPDESTKGTPLYFEYPAAMLSATRLVDIMVRDNNLDTHLCSTSGIVHRVDGRQFLAIQKWVPGALDLEYWRRRNERFQLLDPRSGLVTLVDKELPPGSPNDDPRAPVPEAPRRAIEAFEGWAACFPETTFPSSAKDIQDALKSYRENVEGPDSETTGGRPSISPEIAEAYLDLYPDGHESVGESWKEVLAKVTERLGEDFSVDTLKRALGRKR